MKYAIPYARQLAFFKVGMSCNVPLVILMLNLLLAMNALFFCSVLLLLLIFLFSSSSLLLLPLAQLGYAAPFYLGCSLIEPWDSLSGYVHPGIVCLAF